MAVAVVIPTNRPEQFKLWMDSWSDYLADNDLQVILLVDGQDKNIFWNEAFGEDSILSNATKVSAYDWNDIDKDLGKDSWIIPRRSDTIRSYGFLKAWEQGFDVWTMDDDVRLIEGTDPLKDYQTLKGGNIVGYYNVGMHTDTGEAMRGYPYKNRNAPACVQYGGWTNVPDFDALKQIEHINKAGYNFIGTAAVPMHIGVTGCIMNAYIPHRWIPAMYQLLMGHEEYGVDRNGDIWSGLFMKRVADELREAVVINGAASVEHIRASNPWASLIREASGFESNEGLWEYLVRTKLHGDTPLKVYRHLAEYIDHYEWPGMQEKWVKALPKAMRTWCDILETRSSKIPRRP